MLFVDPLPTGPLAPQPTDCDGLRLREYIGFPTGSGRAPGKQCHRWGNLAAGSRCRRGLSPRACRRVSSWSGLREWRE